MLAVLPRRVALTTDAAITIFWVVFGFLPMLIYGFDVPAGNDINRLNTLIDRGDYIYRFFGHLPIVVLGVAAYYYLTPLVVWSGTRLILPPLHALVATTWVVLSIPFLRFMSAGSNLTIMNVFIAVPLLVKLKTSYWSFVVLIFAVLFHTSTGGMVLAGYTVYSVIKRTPKGILISLTIWIVLIGTGYFLDSSAKYILDLRGSTATATIDNILTTSIGNALVPDPSVTGPLTPSMWVGTLLGRWGYMILFASLAMYIMYRGRYRLPLLKDSISPVLVGILLLLAIITFTPLILDPVRSGGVLVLVLLVAAAALTVKTHISTIIILAFFVGVLNLGTVRYNIGWWTVMGQYSPYTETCSQQPPPIVCSYWDKKIQGLK